MFYEQLSKVCREHNTSVSAVLVALGISKGNIRNWKNGIKPKYETRLKIANYLGIDADDLLTAEEIAERKRQTETFSNSLKKITQFIIGENELEPYNPTHRIPILGYISAGLPLYADEHIEGYTYTDLNHGGEYFALRVKGDSMNAARIFENDLVIIRKQNTVENGEIAVVLVDDDNATVKVFNLNKNIVTLSPQSYNPEHKVQIYDLKNTRIRILGKVVRVQYDI